MPTLNLIVIRAANIDKSRAFYETLGLEFVQEQHGTGSVHYSCQMGMLVIEIYPGKPGIAPERRNAGATMIGFQVENIDNVLAALRGIEGIILSPSQNSEWGKRAVVQDPDGRAIELNQHKQGIRDEAFLS